MAGFDKDVFVADCLAVVREGPRAQQAVKEIVERAIAEPRAIEAEVRPWSESPMMTIWHRSDELTVLHIVWPPDVDLYAHDHNMWATIGVYGGREDNIFWRRLPDDGKGRIEAAGAKSLGPAEVRPLGEDIIHSVTNPTGKLTGAIHVYGGDFVTTERSEWDPENLEERPYDIDKNVKYFEDANRLLEGAD